MIPPLTPEEFMEWLKEAGKTKTFWTKPIIDIYLEEMGDRLSFRVVWVSRGGREARIIISPGQVGIDAESGPTTILILPSDAPPPRHDQRSCIYIWRIPARTLEPNEEVKVDRISSWESDEIFREVQRRSWGFYVPPRMGDHLVLLASLSGRPVGLTYLNVRNFNLDYGIHVVRDHWRRRIGTRLLAEAMGLAGEMGAKYLTVFRWLRRRLDSRDERAMSFYEANRPGWSYMAYRVV